MMNRIKMFLHRLQQRHYEILMKDCLIEEQKIELKAKALYHYNAATRLHMN